MKYFGINMMCKTYTLNTTKHCWDELKKNSLNEERPWFMG